MLFEKLESSSRPAAGVVSAAFGGVIANQIISQETPFVSERPEPFNMVTVTVQGKADLMESLQTLVQGELLTGDNKYQLHDGTKVARLPWSPSLSVPRSSPLPLPCVRLVTRCAMCRRRQVDAIKRQCFAELPPHLILHLKRFEFDLDTLRKRKVNDYCAIPLTLNLKSLSKEGMQAREVSDRRQVGVPPVALHSSTFAVIDGASVVSGRLRVRACVRCYVYDGVGTRQASGDDASADAPSAGAGGDVGSASVETARTDVAVQLVREDAEGKLEADSGVPVLPSDAVSQSDQTPQRDLRTDSDTADAVAAASSGGAVESRPDHYYQVRACNVQRVLVCVRVRRCAWACMCAAVY